MLRRMAVLSILLAIGGAATARPREPRSATTAKKLSDYKVIVVEAFTIDKNPATADFPKGLELLIHARAVQELQAKALFDAVVDAGPAVPEDAAAPNAPLDMRVGAVSPAPSPVGAQAARDAVSAGRRVDLHCVILSFSKGNRAARYVAGFGPGESKLKVRFTLTDAMTGTEIMSWEQTGTFKGTFTPFGGSSGQASDSLANGVVKGLIKQIEKNR